MKNHKLKEDKNMKTFPFPADYLYFQGMVKGWFRFIYERYTKKFLDDVLMTSSKRVVYIRKGRIYWRARIGSAKSKGLKGSTNNKRVFQQDIPYSANEMKPLPGKAKEGRANPKGIPYLYLATNKQTAIQEVRPWIGSFVTIAKCQIVKNLKIIDCSKNIRELNTAGSNRLYLNQVDWANGKLSNSKIEKFVWSQINRAFSAPVEPSDHEANYVPTQILAELFKAENYDGIIYNSMFAKGKNIVLFDVDSVEIINCNLYQITKVPPFEFFKVQPPLSDAIIQRVMNL